MSNVTVLFVTALVMPVPPVNVNVSEINETESVPVSPAIDIDELTEAVLADVILPYVSMARTGTAVEDPYVLAVTPDVFNPIVTEAVSDPEPDTVMPVPAVMSVDYGCGKRDVMRTIYTDIAR